MHNARRHGAPPRPPPTIGEAPCHRHAQSCCVGLFPLPLSSSSCFSDYEEEEELQSIPVTLLATMIAATSAVISTHLIEESMTDTIAYVHTMVSARGRAPVIVVTLYGGGTGWRWALVAASNVEECSDIGGAFGEIGNRRLGLGFGEGCCRGFLPARGSIKARNGQCAINLGQRRRERF